MHKHSDVADHVVQQEGDDEDAMISFTSASSSPEEEVVRAVQIRDEYVERLMEMVARPSIWQKMKQELIAVLDILKVATVEVVEAVGRWRKKSQYPFIWNGENVLLRMSSQLDFLDARPKLREWISLPSLRRNPFLDFHTLDDAEAMRSFGSNFDTHLNGVSFKMTARILSATSVILEEEHLHGKMEYDIPSRAKEKLEKLNTSSKARQFFRRSLWSTWKQFKTLLKSLHISLNPIEMEWLVSWVGSGERKQRVDHRMLRCKVLSPRRVKGHEEEEDSKSSSTFKRLHTATTESLPKWNALQARAMARRAQSQIARAREEMKRMEIEIDAVEASLSSTREAADDESAPSSDGDFSLPGSPSHEIVWRRNQLYKRKIELESRRGELASSIATAERQRRHFEAAEAAAEGVLRDREIVALRIRRDLEHSVVSASDTMSTSGARSLAQASRRLNATQRLEQLRRSELRRQRQVEMEKRRQRRAENEARMASKRRETKKAIQRALKYKQYRESKARVGGEKTRKERKNAGRERARRKAALSSRAASMAALHASLISHVSKRHVRALALDDIEIDSSTQVCVYQANNVNIAEIADTSDDRPSSSIACVVRVYDETSPVPMIATAGEPVSSSANVMRIDLPPSDKLRAIVFPRVPVYNDLALRAWGTTTGTDEGGEGPLKYDVSKLKSDLRRDNEGLLEDFVLARRLVHSLRFSVSIPDGSEVASFAVISLPLIEAVARGGGE